MLYATVAERQGHLDAGRQALIDYAGLVADDADAVQHATRIASLSVKLNDPHTAVAWLERALRMAPDDVRVLAQLADAQMRAGDTSAAQGTIARGLEKDPANRALLALSRRSQLARSSARARRLDGRGSGRQRSPHEPAKPVSSTSLR